MSLNLYILQLMFIARDVIPRAVKRSPMWNRAWCIGLLNIFLSDQVPTFFYLKKTIYAWQVNATKLQSESILRLKEERICFLFKSGLFVCLFLLWFSFLFDSLYVKLLICKGIRLWFGQGFPVLPNRNKWWWFGRIWPSAWIAN